MVRLKDSEVREIRTALTRANQVLGSENYSFAVDRWLADRLADGPAKAADLIAAAERAGYSRASVYAAKGRVGALMQRVGFGPGSYSTWTR
jgi:hypothetical protein